MIAKCFLKNKKLPKMKKIYLLFCLLIVFAIAAKTQKFIRVYDSEGHKIGRGNIDGSSNHSLLVIARGNSMDTIPVQKVAYIKTKHGFGNNILIGTVIGAPVGTILGAIGGSGSSCTDCFEIVSPGAAAAGGFIIGAAAGAVIGAITGVFKNSKTGVIDGDIQKWHEVRLKLIQK